MVVVAVTCMSRTIGLSPFLLALASERGPEMGEAWLAGRGRILGLKGSASDLGLVKSSCLPDPTCSRLHCEQIKRLSNLMLLKV